MKTIKFDFLQLLTTAVFLVLISSCSKDEQSSTSNTAIQKETSSDIDLLMPGSDLIESSVLEKATLDAEFFITDKGIPEDEIQYIELNEKTSTFCCIGKKETEFVKFLNSLNLTPEQKIKLKATINDYNLCRKELYVMIKKIQIEILTKANEQRTLLIRQYKAGEISDRELKSSLENLYERTKNALKESLSKLNVNESFKKCYKAYVENVKLILSKEQWEKWMGWFKKQIKTGTKL
jgi:hypothetical protein